jgi:hypothetical protein
LSTLERDSRAGGVPVSRIRRHDPGCRDEDLIKPGAGPRRSRECLEVQDRLVSSIRYAYLPVDPT